MVVGLLSVLILAAVAGGAREGARWLRSETVGGSAHVIDGDSLRVAGRELRLMGIDAPEYRQTCLRGDREEPCGRQARARLAELTHGAALDCRVYQADRYGRGLAVCWSHGVDINAAMVREGWAVAYGRYETEEAEARRAQRGVWRTRFEYPADWRARHPRMETGS